MDQNGGAYPSAPVPDTTNQVPTPQYVQPQPVQEPPVQPARQVQNQPLVQPQPTNFEMVAPMQQQNIPVAADQPASQQYTQIQTTQTQVELPVEPQLQQQPSNFEMLTPAQQTVTSGAQNYVPAQLYTEPRPTNFEETDRIPVSSAQPDDPLITEDVRPAWQREIFQDSSGNQPLQTEPIQPSAQVVADSGSFLQPTYILPEQDEGMSSVEKPMQPFHLSYDASTGDPVMQTPGQLALRTWLPRIVVLVVLLGLFGGGGFWAYTYGYKTGYTKGVRQSKLANTTQDDSAGSGNQTDNLPELSFDLVEPIYKAETITGVVGEQLQSSDGFVISVQDVERNYNQNDISYQLEANKELIKINFLIGNAAANQPRKITNENFTLKGPVSEVITYESKLTNFEGYINTLTLSSGSQARMSVVFAVDTDATPLTLLWQQPYTLQREASTVTMNIEVALQ